MYLCVVFDVDNGNSIPVLFVIISYVHCIPTFIYKYNSFLPNFLCVHSFYICSRCDNNCEIISIVAVVCALTVLNYLCFDRFLYTPKATIFYI